MVRRVESRSRQIAETLIEAISSQKYPIGATLPGEHQLSAKFKVSRSTIAVALRHLEDLGLVYRRTRTGTQVVSRFPLKNQVEDGSLFQDWARYGIEYIFEILCSDRCRLPSVAAEKETRGARKWLHMAGQRMHIKTRKPICTVHIYVHPDYAGIEDGLSSRPPRIFSVIEARYGILISAFEQEIRAVEMDAESAAAMGVEEGSPALQVARWYRGKKGKLVEFIIVTYPGNQFSYKSRMLRGPL